MVTPHTFCGKEILAALNLQDHGPLTGVALIGNGESGLQHTWCKAALFEDDGAHKGGLLGVGQKLVGVPSCLSIACVGVNVAQLCIRRRQLQMRKQDAESDNIHVDSQSSQVKWFPMSILIKRRGLSHKGLHIKR